MYYARAFVAGFSTFLENLALPRRALWVCEVGVTSQQLGDAFHLLERLGLREWGDRWLRAMVFLARGASAVPGASEFQQDASFQVVS